MWNKSERWAAMKQLRTLIIEDATKRNIDYRKKGLITVGDYIDDQRDSLSTSFINSVIEVLSNQERISYCQQQTIDKLKGMLKPVV